MNNPIKDNRIVGDETFALRLLAHLGDVEASCAMGEEEVAYLTGVAKRLLEWQAETATDKDEIAYLKRNDVELPGKKAKKPDYSSVADFVKDTFRELGMPDAVREAIEGNGFKEVAGKEGWTVEYRHEGGTTECKIYDGDFVFTFDYPSGSDLERIYKTYTAKLLGHELSVIANFGDPGTDLPFESRKIRRLTKLMEKLDEKVNGIAEKAEKGR